MFNQYTDISYVHPWTLIWLLSRRTKRSVTLCFIFEKSFLREREISPTLIYLSVFLLCLYYWLQQIRECECGIYFSNLNLQQIC
jgi:hypothetical protein